MGTAEIFIMSLGLAMDAFSVSVCKGTGMRRLNFIEAVTIALFFGIFQGAMPIAGYFLGNWGERFIGAYSHWVSFILLGYIGAKMIHEAIHSENTVSGYCFDLRELTLLAVAVSVDAFAVGVVFSVSGADILPASAIISSVTFAVSLCGVFIGSRFGGKYEKKAELAGGCVLILIGAKLLIDGIWKR